jgi:hypothetical protein
MSLLFGEWTNKIWYFYTLEYYWAIKKKEICATTWINLTSIMLWKRSLR